MTADEFWEWANRPENRNRRFELDAGEVTEEPPPGELHGILCGWIAHLLWGYVQERNAGAVSTNDTGLLVETNPDSIRGPDLMLFADSKALANLNKKHTTRVPVLVVEVLSPTDRPNVSTRRTSQYLRRGVALVWLVDPENRTVAVHESGQIAQVLDESGELTGGNLLPGLRFAVADFFKLPGESTAV
jgi:Uma2 family endonuclease